MAAVDGHRHNLRFSEDQCITENYGSIIKVPLLTKSRLFVMLVAKSTGT